VTCNAGGGGLGGLGGGSTGIAPELPLGTNDLAPASSAGPTIPDGAPQATAL